MLVQEDTFFRKPLHSFENPIKERMRMAGDALGLGGTLGGSSVPSFKLNTRDLIIPPPAESFKQSPFYSPTDLPIMIDKEILNPGLIGAGGFGVS